MESILVSDILAHPNLLRVHPRLVVVPRLEKHGPAWWKPPRGRGFLKCALNLLGALGPSGHCSVVNLGSPIIYTYININMIKNDPMRNI